MLLLPACSPPSAPFSSRTRNALAIFLAFAVSAHRGVLVVVVVVGALGGMAVYSGEETLKKEGAKKGRRERKVWWPLWWCRGGASVERVRLYVLLYAASAIALASRINYTTPPPRRMFLFHSVPLSRSPSSLTAPRRLTGLSGTIRPVLSCWEESADLFYPPF